MHTKSTIGVHLRVPSQRQCMVQCSILFFFSFPESVFLIFLLMSSHRTTIPVHWSCLTYFLYRNIPLSFRRYAGPSVTWSCIQRDDEVIWSPLRATQLSSTHLLRYPTMPQRQRERERECAFIWKDRVVYSAQARGWTKHEDTITFLGK